MPTPLTVMDPQFSLREYLLEAGLPNPGPFVLIDEDNAVRRIAKELGQDLPPEACYLEQLWVRVDPGGTPDEGGGGTAPDWVPADAKIHVDLVGGSPQGRAWVDGIGEVVVDTLLGSDPNTENGWGPTSYNPVYLMENGYAPVSGSLAIIGNALSAMLPASTFVIRFKTTSSGMGSYIAALSVVGDDAVEYDLQGSGLHAYSWKGSYSETIPDILNVITDMGGGEFVGHGMNAMAITLTPVRSDIAVNGSEAVSAVLTTAEYPTSGADQLVAFVVQGNNADAIQSITIYDPLPTTAGLSELSAIT
jgi:hypothetical protein